MSDAVFNGRPALCEMMLMPEREFQRRVAYDALLRAEQAYMAALRQEYGEAAPLARFDARGEATEELARLRQALREATAAYRELGRE
jgi:hypothetical protein